MARRTFSPEFKRESACMVRDQGYSISEACTALDVGPTGLRRWVKQLSAEQGGITPVGSKALTPDQQRIQALEVQINTTWTTKT